MRPIVQQLLEGCPRHASGSAGVVGRQCARRPAWPTPDGDRHRTGVAGWDEHAIGHLHGSAGARCHSLGGAPVRCCWWSDLDARKRHYLLRA